MSTPNSRPDARPPGSLIDAIQEIIQGLEASSPSNRLTSSQIAEALKALPRLTELDVASLGHKDSMYPICFNTFAAILAEEEMAIAMDSPAHPIESLGVSKLPCAHLFCRKDVSQWIEDAHDSCPICRRLIIQTSSSNPRGADPEEEDQVPLRGMLEDLLAQLSSTEGGPNIHDQFPFFIDVSSGIGHSTRNSNTSRQVPDEYSGMYS